jgi:CubicO group peptidase (beta-lactamase class C family)
MHHTARILLVFLFLSALMFAADSQFPDTPVGRQTAECLKAFNSGDREAYRAYLKANFPSKAEHMEMDHEMAFRERTGGFELRKIENATPTSLVVLVQERNSDQFARVTVEVEMAEPHRIEKMDIHAIPRPDQFALRPLSASELIAALRRELEAEALANRFSGSVLVAKDGKIIFEQAYGLADREHQLPNTLTTRYRIGSMNKMFTAVATMQLVQAGKLRLDDALGKYLTAYSNHEVAEKVTIKELLSHTGGVGDIFGPDFDKHRRELRTLDDYVKLYGNRAPEFEPGSRWEYSNYGFILLGVVIEKVSGESYYDYVSDHIYKPVGMNATGLEPETQAVPERSIGYTGGGSGDSVRSNADTLPYRGTSAGGGYSTVEDLLKFANALQRNQLVNAESTEALTTGKVDKPEGRYGYGFEERVLKGTRCYGHGGGAPGMNGMLVICPVPGYTIAVLSNIDPPAASRVSEFITNRMSVP